MGVARAADGRVLDTAAANAAERQLELAGFSPDGVTLASTGTQPSASETAAGKTGGGSGKTLVVVGGLAAAGGLVAVAAGGGGSDAGGPGSGGSSTGGTVTAPGAALTGRWTGTFEEAKTFLSGPFAGMVCPTSRRDLTVNFVQSGSSLTGDYQLGADTAPGPCGSTTGTTTLTPVSNVFPLTGTASAGAVTFQAGVVTMTGTYSVSDIDVSGTYSSDATNPDSFRDRWTLTRQ